jgi:hypothetical protein
MRTFSISLLFFCALSSTLGQKNISGEYKLYTSVDSTDISQGVILNLNCNNTFIQHDTIATGYGTWSLKNNIYLSLQFDSIAENNRIDIVKTKIIYKIKNDRIYRETIPKREYIEYMNSVKTYFRSIRSPFQLSEFESFSNYKAKELKRYYRKSKEYLCD